MAAPKEITIFPKSPDKSGFVRLHMFVSINNEPGWYPTKVKCLKDAWDQGKQKITSKQIDYKRLNGLLRKRIGQLQQAFDDLDHERMPATVDRIRVKYNEAVTHEITGQAPEVKNRDYNVYEYFDLYVHERRNTLSKGYLRNFKWPQDWMKQLNPKLQFKDVTESFYYEWVNHMIEEGELENNTMYGYIKKLVTVMGAALRDPRVKHMEICTDFTRFNDMYVKPKVHWLDWETELACIEEFDPLPEMLALKQFFLFLCYTGLRHSDAFKIKPENLVKRKNEVFLDHTIIKTKLDQHLQLSSQAVEILKQWNYKVPRIQQHDLNAGIKMIAKAAGEKWKKDRKHKEPPLLDIVEKVRYSGSQRIVSMLPKYEMITTHTGRRTFGRRWAEQDGDLRNLQIYFGHATIGQTEEYIGWKTAEVNAEMKRVIG
jgi:hypothetical protein